VIDGGLNAGCGVQSFATALKPKLLDQVRDTIRMRHYSSKTEDSYVHWINGSSFAITSAILRKWRNRR